MATLHKANEEALKKVKDQLECAICLQPYTNPKVLACFHVYCKHCLKRVVVRGQDGPTITCPKCRRSTTLQQGGVSALQSAFHISHLFDIRDTLQKVKEPASVQCEKCKEATAKGFCRDCGKFVCETCIKVHQKWDELANHQIVGITDIHAESVSLAPPKRKVLYCSKHRDTVLKIYCETCQELICNDCTVRLHKDHEYDLVTDAFPKHQDEIQAHLQPIREKLGTINEALQTLDTEMTNIGECRMTIEGDIHRRVNEIHKALDQRREELILQLDELTQQKLKVLATQKDQIQMLQTQLSSCLEYVEGSLKTGTEGEILAMKAPVVRQIQQIAPEVNPDTLQPQEINNLLLIDDDVPKLIEACQNFLAVTVLTADPTQCYTTGNGLKTATVGEEAEDTLHSRGVGGRLTVVQAKDVDAELVCRQTTVQCKVENVGVSECRILKYKPTTRGPNHLHVTLGGGPTKGSPHSIVVRPRFQDLRKPIKIIGNVRCPRGITTDSKGRIIVTEAGAYCVTIFTPEGEKVQSFGSEGARKGQFKSSIGLTVDKGDNIYVGDLHLVSNCVQKFTPKGEHLISVGCQGSKRLKLNHPHQMAFNPRNEKLYISDRNNDRVQILDTSLTYCDTINGRKEGEGNFSHPQGVAFDGDGNTYITCEEQIQVFTPKGDYLRTIGSRGSGPGELRDAEGIAIDHDKVYVTDLANNRVSIFTTTGQFLHSFGSRGKKPGQFDCPRGITIDGNGYILVADESNNRIQIF